LLPFSYYDFPENPFRVLVCYTLLRGSNAILLAFVQNICMPGYKKIK